MQQETDVLDNNYPLMIRLREKTPGTYSHSRAVADLLSAVAAAVGLDEYKLSVAGMYHDIGKTVHPKMFTENQVDGESNPHDKLDPTISLRYITAHVGDTAQILLNDPNIPVEVVRWCTQHHGSLVAKSFYWKRKKSRAKVKFQDYRYPTSRPECLEAALLMMCDILEAKCRALSQASKLENIEPIVDSTIAELENDQQLDDVELTFGKLRVIKNTLKKELSAQYHKRIEYEEEEPNTEEE